MPTKRLAPCPSSPNCVSSEAQDSSQYIDPYIPGGDPRKAWQALRAVLAELPRTVVKTAEEGYIRAESRSWLFGFVDDVEFLWLPEANRIAIRSASRTGWSDLGVNRKRLETIRKMLQKRRVIR